MNPAAREAIWTYLLDADYMARYYAYLANQLARREQILAAAVIFLSSGGLALMITSVGVPYLSESLAFLTALIGVYLFSSRPGRVALLCSWEAHRWKCLLLEYEDLWDQIEFLNEGKLRQRWLELAQKCQEGTEAAPVEFPMVRKLMQRAQKEVVRDRAQESAAANQVAQVAQVARQKSTDRA